MKPGSPGAASVGTLQGQRWVQDLSCSRYCRDHELCPVIHADVEEESVARVRSFGPSHQRVKAHPTEVDCQHVVIDDGSERLLHLSTFGSDDRASERKSSQSIQLDLESARQLVEIIEQAFPELRHRQRID